MFKLRNLDMYYSHSYILVLQQRRSIRPSLGLFCGVVVLFCLCNLLFLAAIQAGVNDGAAIGTVSGHLSVSNLSPHISPRYVHCRSLVFRPMRPTPKGWAYSPSTSGCAATAKIRQLRAAFPLMSVSKFVMTFITVNRYISLSLTYSVTHSLTPTHSLIHSFTHSLTLSFTYSLTHSLIHSLTLSPTL